MKCKRRRVWGLAAVCSWLVLAVCASAASAAVHPSASISFANGRVNVGQSLTVNYATAHLPKHATVYLQRQFGTRRVFKSIMKLKAGRGSMISAGLPMGRYGYRIAVMNGRQLSATSATLQAYFYGTVSAAQLCNNYGDFPGDCTGSSIQVGATVFNWIGTDNHGNTSYEGNADLSWTRTSCRSASISFALSNTNSSSQDTSVSAALTQSSADMQQTSAPAGSIGMLNVSISSGSWDLIFWTPTGESEVYWNGTFQCWTPTGNA